jgi:hypothetical protein
MGNHHVLNEAYTILAIAATISLLDSMLGGHHKRPIKLELHGSMLSYVTL